ncbi:MAG: ATP-binding cassette domain-containing protein [Actinobacteria bacterium]|nr:ATP-binding cassette domain-containing protein [Actinomycetota bacterium]
MEEKLIIEVKNLVKKFKNITAVNDISFTVKKNEIFGFLGPNGAGKTTTINIICTLLKLNSGSVTLCGYDVATEKNRIRNCIGLVFQDPTLDDRLTALENLNFHALLYNVPHRQIKERIDSVLEMVDLLKRKNDLVRTFSGGMKRRLEIARGLIHYPKVLFLDEPTIGLDPQTRNKIWEYIVKLKKTNDITIFLTTHYMEESEICDRIAIMDEGKIIAMDTPDTLKNMIGLDIITIISDDNKKLKDYLKEKFSIDAELTKNNEVRFEVKDSAKFIPYFIRHCHINILSINARKSTLNDVFLSLTGKEIREESANKKDAMRMHMRARARR